ncbi:NADH dehydrogenase [ubiquinone] 1 alpha subcomplex assembly factor 4 [Tetranychus urticae]|uniref:NADH dehydrogenase [ubiquinone] 1 alpha subcomplex assembly factor 4 n=1 Tax=Tetranychus urticae TaxID=32264 RepID=T1KSY8_TETUR|nr:NADH dehydrogenase [ubiquinone] 1 alpha subcomplex assembly factor 4 [Tetranychus urticae]
MEKAIKFAKSVFHTIIRRPIQNYNVEERAFKAISVTKKNPAPKHLTTQQKILKYIEEHPELKEIVVEKPKTLLEWLKKIRVVSHGVPDTELFKTDKRKLPVKRETYELPRMFGEIEPKVIPEGKISLQRTTNLVMEYASMKIKPSSKEIAEKYNLEEQDAANLVRHFKAFELYKPAKETGDYEGLPPWSKTVKNDTFLGMLFSKQDSIEEPKKLIDDKSDKETDRKQIKAE